MSGLSIWEVLGLPPTDDQRAIKRAYAQQLKRTHPEDDAAGFQVLRQAYEQAMSIAAHEAARAHAAEPVEELYPEPQDQIVESYAPEEDSHEAHWRICGRLEQLLAMEHADPAAMTAALEAVLHTDSMENLEIFADTEVGLARVLLHFAPRGDVLLPRAIQHFGWYEQEDRWDLSPEIQGALSRERALAVMARLSDRRHEHHLGYMTLCAGPLETMGFWRRLRLGRRHRPVAAFLNFAVGHAPGVLHMLDQEAVEAWERRIVRREKTRQARSTFWVLGAFLAVVLLLFAAAQFDRPQDLSARAAAEPNNPSLWADLCRERARGVAPKELELNDCERALALAPRSLGVLGDRALIKARIGDMAGAVRDYDALLGRSPGNVRALYGRGAARIAMGEPVAGAADQALATELDPAVAVVIGSYQISQIAPRPAIASRAPEILPPGEIVGFDSPAAVLERPEGVSLTAAYPERASRAGASGSVKVRCRVRLDGRADDCVVLAETPQDLGFDDAAIGIAEQFVFAPARLRGKSVDGALVTIPVTFSKPEG